MNVTAEHAGRAVVLELDEGCRSVAALRRIICAALPDLKEDGFDVKMQGRAVEDVDVCGLEEGTTIQVVESRRAVALQTLRAAGCDVSEEGLKHGVFYAVKNGDVELCEQYLDAGASPDVDLEYPLLYMTLGVDNGAPALDVCKLLLSRGADANIDFATRDKKVLHIAAELGFPEFCRLLLHHGADVNHSDWYGYTPLHYCLDATQEHHAVREVLLSHGADMRATWCEDGSDSPLAHASEREPGEKPPPFDAYTQFIKYAPPSCPGEDGRKYSRFIHQLAKVQFKKRKQQITWKGMRIVNAFVEDVLERLGGEAGRAASLSEEKTLSVRSVVAAVKLQLPEELATHALAAGAAAVRRHAKVCVSDCFEQCSGDCFVAVQQPS